MKIVNLNVKHGSRTEKRFMGGSVNYGRADVRTDAPIFAFVQERLDGRRVVLPGSDLDTSLRDCIRKSGNRIVGGNPIHVVTARDGHDFTVEYTADYKTK